MKLPTVQLFMQHLSMNIDVVTCQLAVYQRVVYIVYQMMAAILGLRLTLTLLRVLRKSTTDATFYSHTRIYPVVDRCREKDFRPSVTNRVGETRMHSNPVQWQYVPESCRSDPKRH